MTKAELISALEWFKDDAELHIVVPHEALDDLHEVMSLDSARYNLIPPRVELVAKRTAQETCEQCRGARFVSSYNNNGDAHRVPCSACNAMGESPAPNR